VPNRRSGVSTRRGGLGIRPGPSPWRQDDHPNHR
jgi:hypothetical protein